MWAGVIWLGLPSIDVEADVHLRHRLERLDQRVADQVGERHLAAAGARQVVVDDDPVVPEQLDRDRADRGGGGDGQGVVHVGDGAGRARRAARCTSAGRPPRPGRGLRLLGHRAIGALGRLGGLAVGPRGCLRLAEPASPAGRLRGWGLRGRLPSRPVPRRPASGGCSAAGAAGRVVAVGGLLAVGRAAEPDFLKYAAQVGSTLPGSRVNWSYISSTSHSLAPKSEEGSGCEDGSDGLVCCCGTGAFASSGTCAWMSGSGIPG